MGDNGHVGGDDGVECDAIPFIISIAVFCQNSFNIFLLYSTLSPIVCLIQYTLKPNSVLYILLSAFLLPLKYHIIWVIKLRIDSYSGNEFLRIRAHFEQVLNLILVKRFFAIILLLVYY